jgi:phytoene dehydrogenase-like protein
MTVVSGCYDPCRKNKDMRDHDDQGVHMAEQAGPFDAIVIGSGHNGLVAASYLAGAKLKVLVLERYSEVGGAAISEETFPGFKISTGSYVLSLAPRKIFDELGAWAEGIELLERNPRFFAPFPDGSSLTYWKDHDEWIKQIRRISPKDADAYDHYDDYVERACAVMDKYILRRPPSWAEVAANFKTPEDALIFQKFYLGSAADIAEYFFDSEQMRAIVSASGLIGTFRGPRDGHGDGSARRLGICPWRDGVSYPGSCSCREEARSGHSHRGGSRSDSSREWSSDWSNPHHWRGD